MTQFQLSLIEKLHDLMPAANLMELCNLNVAALVELYKMERITSTREYWIDKLIDTLIILKHNDTGKLSAKEKIADKLVSIWVSENSDEKRNKEKSESKS